MKGIGTKGRKDHEQTVVVEEVSIWQSRVGCQKIGP